jgi:sugar phosphate isomerase/epimerase
MGGHGQSRRELLSGATAALGAVLTGAAPAGARDDKADPPAREPFAFMLNTATIRGQNLPLVDEIELASRCGYQAIEPWASELDKHVKDGGSLKDLGKRVRDNGLTVESCIAFAEWVVDDEARRKKGLEESRRIMDMLQQIGGKRLAAPPAGATNQTDLPLLRAAERYRDLMDLGAKMGVTPVVEFWGFSKTLSRLGEALLVAVESGRSDACVLVDVFHLYKGGSGFTGLALVGAPALPVIHMNDYPAAPPRAEITDQFRVYPGDGVAPLKEMLRDLHARGFRGFLSLELFNHEYWQKDALLVARTGLEKMRALVHASLEALP